MQIDDLAKMRRPRFFFAFEKELEVERRSKSARFHRIKRRENRGDPGLIIRSRARVQSPFRIDFATRRQRHDLAARFHRCGSPRWLKRRRRGPRRWVDGLPVVMRINYDRACGARYFP